MQQFVNDFMNDKIKSILSDQETKEEEMVNEIDEIAIDESKTDIVTTDEELEGFNIVKSILSEATSVDNITYKDVKSYFGILFNNNTRKWICRLYFNSSKKYIAVPDKEKYEIYYEIEALNDIYKYKNELLNSLDKFIKKA